MRASRLQLLLILLALGLILLRESRQSPGDAIENRFVDWLSTNTTRSAPPAPVVLVEINDASMEDGHMWPWSPLDFSLFVQAALPFSPNVVAIEYTLLWDETTPAGPDWAAKQPQYERILHDFLLRAPKALLGARLGFPEDPDVIPPLQPFPVLRHFKGGTEAVPQFITVERQPKEEFRLAPKLGFTNLPGGGTPIRTAPLVLNYRGELVPSFVLQAMMLYYELTPDDVQIYPGSYVDLGGKVRVPIDRSGAMRIDFKSPYTRFGFDDLLLAAQQREANRAVTVPADKLKNAITLLARTDRQSRTIEFPSGVHGSSGELLAAAMATIQNKTFIRRLPEWAEVVLLGAVLALCACFPGWRPGFVLQSLVAFLVVYLLIGLAVFSVWLVWLPLVMPFGVLLFAALYRLFAPQPA